MNFFLHKTLVACFFTCCFFSQNGMGMLGEIKDGEIKDIEGFVNLRMDKFLHKYCTQCVKIINTSEDDPVVDIDINRKEIFSAFRHSLYKKIKNLSQRDLLLHYLSRFDTKLDEARNLFCSAISSWSVKRLCFINDGDRLVKRFKQYDRNRLDDLDRYTEIRKNLFTEFEEAIFGKQLDAIEAKFSDSLTKK